MAEKQLTSSSDLQGDATDTSLGNSQLSNTSETGAAAAAAVVPQPEMKNVQDLTRYVKKWKYFVYLTI